MNAQQSKKPNPKDRVQLTRNVGDHLYGQTFTREQAEQLGIEPTNLRDLVTDRAVDEADTKTR